MTDEPPPTRFEQLKRALDAGVITQDTFDAAVGAMGAQLSGSGAIAQGQDAVAVGAEGVFIRGDNSGDVNTGKQLTAAEGAQVIYAEKGATVVIGDAPIAMTAVERESVLGRYLQHLISQNRYLQLQGIRSGGKLVNIELDRIYVTLRATRQPTQRAEVDWLAREMALAPGERQRGKSPPSDTTDVTVNEALKDHKRLVVLGDPGSGKTTLLRYVALLYARDLAETGRLVDEKLGLAKRGVKSDILPIFLPLRQIGRYLAEHRPNDDGTEGHAILLEFLAQMLDNERVKVTATFFDE
jgi:hypothetical protein